MADFPMKPLRSFQDLEVWKKSIDLAERVYSASKSWPADERFGLVQQARRAAASVAANIAEGAGRRGQREFLHFLSIAGGSLAETRTYLILAERLNYVEKAELLRLQDLASEVSRMLHGLSKSLRSNLAAETDD